MKSHVGHLAVNLLIGVFCVSADNGAKQNQIPLPEYYGIYAVEEGSLLPIFGAGIPSQATVRNVELFSFKEGSAKTFSAIQLSGTTRFIVFDQASGDLVRRLRLYRLPYARNLIPKDAFTGEPRRPIAMNKRLAARVEILAYSLLAKPVPSQPQMVEVKPQPDMSPGVYLLLLEGEGRFRYLWIVVDSEETVLSADCVDISFSAGMIGRMEMSDYYMRHGPAEFPVITREHYSACSTDSYEGMRRPAQPAPEKVECSDYESCLKAGATAFDARQLDQAFSYSEEASRLTPGRGEAWVMMASVHFERGNYDSFWQMTDRALQLGSALDAKICRDRFLGCEQGTLILSNKEVAFLNTRNQKLFSAPPSQFSSRGATLYSQAPAAYSFLSVAGKDYRLYFIPRAIKCQIDLVPVCPEPGFTQQKVFANYVHHAIQGLTSGTLTKPEPPPGPPANAVVPGGTIGQFRHGSLVTRLPSGSLVLAPTPVDGTHTHAGVDITAQIGTPVYAVADGTVVDLVVSDRDTDFTSLGYMVIIKHTELIEGKETYSAYFHLFEPPAVAFGHAVLGGRTQIGAVGKSGAATGPHLHLEVRYFRSRYYEHPEWNNIYGMGDQRSKPDFLNKWSDPEKLGVKLH